MINTSINGAQAPHDLARITGEIENRIAEKPHQSQNGTGGNPSPDPASNYSLQPPTEHSGNPPEIPKRKKTITLGELLRRPLIENRYLIEKYCPIGTLGLLVGRPDTGKSMWARQLALAIIAGESTFLGMKLYTRYQQVIFLTTEDGENETHFIMRQMLKSKGLLTQEMLERMRFIFTESMSPADMLAEIKRQCIIQPADVIFADSLGDVFSGKDSNSNAQARQFLPPFYEIAELYGTLVLFVHHINKSGYDDVPSQRHIQGASALTQKPRIAIQILSPKDDDMKYMLVLKGNSVSKEYKTSAIQLAFSEEDFSFTTTGVLKRIEEFGAVAAGAPATEVTSKKYEMSEPKRDYTKLFLEGEHALHFNELVKRAMVRFGISEATAKRDIPKYLAKNSFGLYVCPANALEIMQKDGINALDSADLQAAKAAPLTFGGQIPEIENSEISESAEDPSGNNEASLTISAPISTDEVSNSEHHSENTIGTSASNQPVEGGW